MNQGKLEVVKKEMARVNVDSIGISKLKWTGMGEFNSDDHYIYYCGQESLRRHGVAIMVNKRLRNAVLGCNLKNDRILKEEFPTQYVPSMLLEISGEITPERMKERSQSKKKIPSCGCDWL